MTTVFKPVTVNNEVSVQIDQKSGEKVKRDFCLHENNTKRLFPVKNKTENKKAKNCFSNAKVSKETNIVREEP